MGKNRPLIRETWDFIKARKAYWLVPIVLMLLAVSVLIILSQASTVSPFVYAFI